jgi:hypothetical protein
LDSAPTPSCIRNGLCRYFFLPNLYTPHISLIYLYKLKKKSYETEGQSSIFTDLWLKWMCLHYPSSRSPKQIHNLFSLLDMFSSISRKQPKCSTRFPYLFIVMPLLTRRFMHSNKTSEYEATWNLRTNARLLFYLRKYKMLRPAVICFDQRIRVVRKTLPGVLSLQDGLVWFGLLTGGRAACFTYIALFSV